MSRTRHESRLKSIQLLYRDEFYDRFNIGLNGLSNENLDIVSIDDKDDEYCLFLYNGVIEHKAECDELIKKYSARPIDRINILDLCILRLATFSMLYDDSIRDEATKAVLAKDNKFIVIINEAIRLSSEFSGSTNYKYINAVLDKISKDLKM